MNLRRLTIGLIGCTAIILLFGGTMDAADNPVFPIPEQATKATPPFGAEVEIEIRTGNLLQVTETGSARFLYSNGWWRVQYIYKSPDRCAGDFFDVRNIPDGSRYMSVGAKPLEPGFAPTARATSRLFPLREQGAVLACWLFLRPNPELPIVDNEIMRELTYSWALEHPENRCRYLLKRLEPENEFITALYVTNNGISFLPIEKAVSRYRPPYDAGFLTMSYEVTRTTNVADRVFPSEAVLRRYSTRPNGITVTDLDQASEVALRVVRLDSYKAITDRLLAIPPEFMGDDLRHENIPGNLSVLYKVTNDTWLAVSDPAMVRFVNIYRGAIRLKPKERSARARSGILLAVGIASAVPLAFLWFRSRRNTINA